MSAILWTCEVCGETKPKKCFRRVVRDGRDVRLQPCKACTHRRMEAKRTARGGVTIRPSAYKLVHDPDGSITPGSEFHGIDIQMGLRVEIPCWLPGTVFERQGVQYVVIGRNLARVHVAA